MERYFVIYCSIGGQHYRFYIIAADPEEAKREAAKAAYNYYNFRLEDAATRTKEITEKEYYEL